MSVFLNLSFVYGNIGNVLFSRRTNAMSVIYGFKKLLCGVLWCITCTCKHKVLRYMFIWKCTCMLCIHVFIKKCE